MLLSARMTNKVWHGWDLLGFYSGAYILADKIWLNLAACRQQASFKQRGPQRRKWAITCLCPNMDLPSLSSAPQPSAQRCTRSWVVSELCRWWQVPGKVLLWCGGCQPQSFSWGGEMGVLCSKQSKFDDHRAISPGSTICVLICALTTALCRRPS